jgi:hypothetical protein
MEESHTQTSRLVVLHGKVKPCHGVGGVFNNKARDSSADFVG